MEEASINDDVAEALRTRTTIRYLLTNSVPSGFPLGQVSTELKVEPGRVSLLPDPKDQGSGLIAVYLANATDKAVHGADSNYAHCFLEVRDGNRWRACERFSRECGTGIPDPEDLQPGHARIFLGTDPNRGNMAGELRFCLVLPHVRPVVSAPFHGRFSSERFEEADLLLNSLSMTITHGLDGKGWGKADGGSPIGIARSPEECLAAAELDRCYDESSATRSALIRWQAGNFPGDEMSRCRAALEALLKRPWDRQQDTSALFERCFTALSRRGGGDAEFGSPERCRAMVWRYLRGFGVPNIEVLINPERWDRLEVIRLSGNPWGVDQNQAIALVEEAITSLRSSDRDERDAAGAYLCDGRITPVHLPDKRCWAVLERDVDTARYAAISALSRREKRQQAGQWLAEHRELPGLKLASLWEAASGSTKEFADWEVQVALRLLETSPLEATQVLKSRCVALADAGGKKLPIELREPLRRFLADEAEAKRLGGLPPPKPAEDSNAGSQTGDPRYFEPVKLWNSLFVLAAWNDPADTPLLINYLAHPAASFSTSEQKVTRRYEVRRAAAQFLKERNEIVPDGVVFEEPVR